MKNESLSKHLNDDFRIKLQFNELEGEAPESAENGKLNGELKVSNAMGDTQMNNTEFKDSSVGILLKGLKIMMPNID